MGEDSGIQKIGNLDDLLGAKKVLLKKVGREESLSSLENGGESSEFTNNMDGKISEQEDPFLKYIPSTTQRQDNWNTLHVALMYRASWEELQEILRRKPELAEQVDKANMTPMHRALLQQEYFYRVDSFLAVLDACSDAAKIPDIEGNYPLHTAVYCMFPRYFDTREGNSKYLEGASRSNKLLKDDVRRNKALRVVKGLIDAYPPAVNLKSAKRKDTPLHITMKSQSPLEFIRLLLEASTAPTRSLNKLGQTPLMIGM